jgi:hypothetical protein
MAAPDLGEEARVLLPVERVPEIDEPHSERQFDNRLFVHFCHQVLGNEQYAIYL